MGNTEQSQNSQGRRVTKREMMRALADQGVRPDAMVGVAKAIYGTEKVPGEFVERCKSLKTGWIPCLRKIARAWLMKFADELLPDD